MKPAQRKAAVLSACLMLLGLCVMEVWAREEAAPEDPFTLLSIGEVSTTGMKIDVKPENSPGQAIREGDRLRIDFTPDRKGYLTVLNVSSDGRVSILFPNRRERNSLVTPDKTYTLVGGSSQTQAIVEGASEKGGTVFYLSPKPLPLRSIASGRLLDSIPWKRIRNLAQELRSLAKLQGFSRMMLPLQAGLGKTYDIKFVSEVEPASPRTSRPKLMGPKVSEPPESLTGAAGIKQKPSP
ncbi:MAG: DUF4384 domain-containing protein [Desulfomonile tiedjei]|uniref:DUF4384 domain-containing protein n=1 Tax=Desulfomonile tiedjei TaxID=2358 RepID=A0A9D6Z159_9BACT|nr:DUF4384 domain-containing protein [Desulfomonile tiedjei]